MIREEISKIFPISQYSWKEIYLTSLPTESQNILDFSSEQTLTETSKKPINPPKFSYSQTFTHNNTLYFFKVNGNTIKICTQYLVYPSSRIPIPKDSFSIMQQSPTKQKFFNQRLILTLIFSSNISSSLCFGSLGFRPYVLIPFVNGQITIIDLKLEDFLFEKNVKGSSFFLNINEAFLLNVQNISYSFKDNEAAWNLPLVCGLSNGNLSLFQASIQANFNKINIGQTNMENTPLINPHSEINLFYSGFLGKIKNYSDYYLRNNNDLILCCHHFSNFICFVLTKEMSLKIINVLNKTVIFETILNDLKAQRNFSNETPWPSFKLLTLDRNPLVANKKDCYNMILVIAEMNNIKKNSIKLLNVSFNAKKFLDAKKIDANEFDLSLYRSEQEIFSSAEITSNENLQISSGRNHEILDCAINYEGIWVAAFDNNNSRSETYVFEFKDEKSMQPMKIFNFDEKLDNLLSEDQLLQEISSAEDFLDRLFLDQRYPTYLLSSFLEENYIAENKITFRKTIKENLREILINENVTNLDSLKNLEKQSEQVNMELKENNRIQCIFLDQVKGVPIIWRENSINCLIKIGFIEEIIEKSEQIKSLFFTTNNNHFFVYIKELAECMYPTNEIFKVFFQINQILKSTLQISQEKLLKSIINANENDESFMTFLSTKLKEQLHFINEFVFEALKRLIHSLFILEFSPVDFLTEFLNEILSRKFEINEFPDSKDIIKKNFLMELDDWSCLIYSLCAGKLKTSLNAYAEMSLNILIFFFFLENFDSEYDLPIDFTNKLFCETLKKLSRFTEMLLCFNFSLGQFFNGIKETLGQEENQIKSDLLEGDQFIDVSKVFILENHSIFFESSKNFDYNKSNIWLERSTNKILNYLMFLDFNRLEIDYIPKIMRFFLENGDFHNVLCLCKVLKLKNPAIEFLKCRALLKKEEIERIDQPMNFVNSFVNLEKIPNNLLSEKTENRRPLCLGPWLDYHNIDMADILKEGGPSVVLLQNILIDNDKFFSNPAMKNSISFNTLFLSPLNLKIKVKCFKELINFHLGKGNFDEALNLFIVSFKQIGRDNSNNLYFLNIMEDFHKIGKLSLLLSMPMDDLIISKIEEVILSQIDDHIDFIIRSIKEKLRDLIDLNEISDKLNTIWFQFKSQTSLFHTLIQFYLDKSAFVEACEILIHHLKKLFKITFVQEPLTREFYQEILNLCIYDLRFLLFVSDLQKPEDEKNMEKIFSSYHSNLESFLNKEYFQQKFELNQKRKDIIDGKYIENDEEMSQTIDLAKIFGKINIQEPIPQNIIPNKRSEPCLKINDFRRLLKKILLIKDLINRVSEFESHKLYPIDIDSENLIKYSVKSEMIEEAVNFVVSCEVFSLNLMIYLGEIYYKLSNGVVHEKYTKETVWKLAHKIIINSEESKKKEYCKVFSEKILRNYLQKNNEENQILDLPAPLKEIYLKTDPTGLILLYLKYKKNEKAAEVVLNYIRTNIIEGNQKLLGNIEKEENLLYIPPNIILTVLNHPDNLRYKIEIEKLLSNLNI